MTITTITELKQEAYLLKSGEIITSPLYRNKKEPLYLDKHTREYNFVGSSIIFYDEDSTVYLLPISILDIVEEILKKNGYLRNGTMYVPLSNGFDYPELKDKWEAIKKRCDMLLL